ncbi:hypothetical protein VOLCADRAFT_100617 [Volvox carteri f. nagariensis]|uniref:Uncharacterized protein n=1 Tax=Volvox carteri f. nagariensis TaxID=3068 RepID=D8UKM9_VOLCA|nr:uncharacterized protein VOLCADRAFT_100617 [Volvox carteri f. nagariensis]EFJ39717.1 hypothetical protein VOLCADRAFT_100617 [Volvox carteri f. nagariensis]|eukprot:XP_002959224.1 hypothetical protein VOLCADRAFT_100617 [Volvox carteri f. nagariensis]
MPRHAFSAIKCCLHMLACSPWPVDHQLRASHPQQLHLVIVSDLWSRSKCMSWVLGALLHANNTQAGRNECYGVVNFKVLCPVQIDAKAHAHSRETSKQDYICQVFLLVHSVQVYVLGIRCIVACQ